MLNGACFTPATPNENYLGLGKTQLIFWTNFSLIRLLFIIGPENKPGYGKRSTFVNARSAWGASHCSASAEVLLLRLPASIIHPKTKTFFFLYLSQVKMWMLSKRFQKGSVSFWPWYRCAELKTWEGGNDFNQTATRLHSSQGLQHAVTGDAKHRCTVPWVWSKT